MNVAVLGASNKPERYSYLAVQKLLAKGHTPFPVHPVAKQIGDLKVYASLSAVPEKIDAITVYLSPANSSRHADEIVACKARRVIFNPGAENPRLADRLRSAGVEVLEACTLVLLSTNQF